MTILNKEILIRQIENLCKERKISQTTAYVESGVGKNFKSNMKTANPSRGKITMLATYFGVSVDYLLGNTDKKESPSELSEEDRIALKAFKSLTAEQRKSLLQLMRSMGEGQKES